jgi:hypothetical protein
MSTWSFTLDHGGDITALVDVASINRTVRLHTDLKPNVNKLSFRVRYDSSLFGNLLSYDPIEIQVDKDAAAYFTGFLSPNYKAQIRDGQRYIDLIAEDPTLQTLGKIISEPWSAAGFAICTPSAQSTSLVHALCTAAGCGLAAGAPTISSVVPYVVVLPEDKKTYGGLLAEILYEYGYGYGFDPDGALALYELVNPGTITTSGTLTTAAGTANIRGEVLIEKTPERYDDIRVSYDLVELKTGIVVFQDADEITMAAAGDAGGADYYPLTSKIGEVYSAWKSPDGYTIWVVTSGTLSASLESGISLVSALTNYYKKASFAYRNTAAGTRKITGLKITGNAYVVSSKNVVRSNTTGGKLLMEHKAQYIFADAAAQALAEKLGQYYRYADIKYTVRSADVFALGAYVTVSDAIYAGISTKCRIVGITQKEAPTVIYEYALEGVADFVAISTITEGGHDGTPTSGNFGDSDYYLNTPPSANVMSLAISSEPNPNGNEDVTFEFDYTQGTVPADGFLIFTKQAITTPGSIDINTDRAHFVPVGADGSYSVTLTLPTRQAGAGTIALHYRFGVVSFGTRRSGTVVHLAGPVEASGWTDVTFVSELTDMPIRSYNGEGVNRRAIQIDNEAIDWLDTPDTSPASPELLAARIGRLGVGGQVLLDGEFQTLISAEWTPELVISGEVIESPAYGYESGGSLRVAYRRSGDGYLVERLWDGAAWGAASIINNTASLNPSYIGSSNYGLRVTYYNSSNQLVERLWSGTAWGSENIIEASGASGIAVYTESMLGLLSLYYKKGTDIIQKIWSGTAWDSGAAVVSGATTYNLTLTTRHSGERRMAYRRALDNYLVERVYSGGAWSSEAIINNAPTYSSSYIELINGELQIFYQTSAGKVANRIFNGSTWGGETIISNYDTAFITLYQSYSGVLRLCYKRLSDGYLVERTLQRYAQIGAGIIESGSNADGSYIKFSDGTIQQWRHIVSPVGAANTTITLPHPVLYIPSYGGGVVHCSYVPTVNANVFCTAWLSSGTEWTYYISASQPIYLSYIGRWK